MNEQDKDKSVPIKKRKHKFLAKTSGAYRRKLKKQVENAYEFARTNVENFNYIPTPSYSFIQVKTDDDLNLREESDSEIKKFGNLSADSETTNLIDEISSSSDDSSLCEESQNDCLYIDDDVFSDSTEEELSEFSDDEIIFDGGETNEQMDFICDDTENVDSTKNKYVIEKNDEFVSKFATLAIMMRTPHSHLKRYLELMREYLPLDIPKDPRTLLSTPKSSSLEIIKIDDGDKYWVYGLKMSLVNVLGKI